MTEPVEEEPWVCAVHGPVEGPAHFRFMHEDAWAHNASYRWIREAEPDELARQTMYTVAGWQASATEREARHLAMRAEIRDCPTHGLVADQWHYLLEHTFEWDSVFYGMRPADPIDRPVEELDPRKDLRRVHEDSHLGWVLRVRSFVKAGRVFGPGPDYGRDRPREFGHRDLVHD